jgi:archaemetzincin
MVHEIGHMFGLRHCIYYSCIMNGSNNLEENLSKPIYLCPICLRKLQYNLKFNILERYKELQAFCSQHEKFQDASEFYL